ncbi:hypothetical protein TUBRATIS_006380 [Tubulinosema ratisbonensis]|uniref:Uncharacterized protein n=1 Tax=Tubulinosema ratisbonensis TaxID=291195 RepID=A0A437AP04_9MICR|nr:hypothetical protein TUBRATIS_006380 [Tubulinosema ratisbonensis]
MLILQTLKKIPDFILVIDPHNKSKLKKINKIKLKKLSKTLEDETHFLDKQCNKLCDCEEPNLIILIDHVLHFDLGCFKLIRQAEIFFRTEWYDNILEDALKFYSECEIKNGL